MPKTWTAFTKLPAKDPAEALGEAAAGVVQAAHHGPLGAHLHQIFRGFTCLRIVFAGRHQYAPILGFRSENLLGHSCKDHNFLYSILSIQTSFFP